MILQGDSLAVLKTLADESVHCCVTSPPYWGLRDYGVAGQLGMEPTLSEHIQNLVVLFREVRRVLRSDGTLWMNYGDAYACAPNGRSAAATKEAGNDDRTFRDKPMSTVGPIFAPNHESGDRRGPNSKQARNGEGHNGRVVAGGYLKPKDRMLLPARVAIALQEDGWWVRDEIVWHKPNPMPSSVKDRTTPAHEMIYLLSKRPKYYFDHAAIRTPPKESTIQRLSQDVESQEGSKRANGGVRADRPMKALRGRGDKQGELGKRQYSGFNERWDEAEKAGAIAGSAHKRSVWTVAPRAFKEAHFATFPPALIEPCILAGCPERCCAKCGTPYAHITKETFVPQQDVSPEKGVRGAGNQKPLDASNHRDGFPRGTTEIETLGFAPACKCDADSKPGVVLDPFFGAGTTGMVASQLGRDYIGIELNLAYIAIAEKRLGIVEDIFA